MEQSVSYFAKIASSFYENMNALAVLVKTSGEYASQRDIETLQQLQDISAKIDAILEPENFETVSEPEQIDNTEENKLNPPDVTIRRLYRIKDRSKMDELQALVARVRRVPPRQAHLLHRGTLVLAVSYFEMLLAKLLEGFYGRHPQALPDTHSLTLSELRDSESIQEAVHLLIQKEAETVLHKNTRGQLEYFKKTLKLDVSELGSHLDVLYEIVLRRNLVVHNDSIVNRHYTRGVGDGRFVEGESIPVTKEYLLDAIDSIFLVGAYLLQTGWRKWEKGESGVADHVLQRQVYEILCDERHQLTIDLSAALCHSEHISDSTCRILIINKAIALKIRGDVAAMSASLNSYDWSSCALKFEVALNVLKDDKKSLFANLPKALSTSEITPSDLRDWPLFKGLHSDPDFAVFLDS